jgi:hypothetical protein
MPSPGTAVGIGGMRITDHEIERGGPVRDEKLLSHAQRAAEELGRAWSQWRNTRGLAQQQPDSLAGYVAHSIDHPFGCPRVVLGLDADEARALAAVLEKIEPIR